ncbi:MAG: zinc-binding dehydrogenase [Bacillota bacterium]
MIRAAVMPGPHRSIEIREYDYPDMEDGSILLRTIASEVCGTDVHLWHGRLAGVPYPIIPGHVSVGTIACIEGEVLDVEGVPLEEGDVVTFLDVHETCGSCWYCSVAGSTTRCPHRRVYGITYGADEGLLGGWSEYIYLKPGMHIIKLPQNLTARTFIAGGCGLPTAFHAVQRGDIQMGDTVAVLGSGPVGLNAVILAQLRGATRVVLIGGPAHRLEMGENLGADYILDIAAASFAERLRTVQGLTGGRGADVTIEATGEPEAVAQAMALTRDAGTVVIAGQYTDAGEVTINPHLLLNKKHLDVRGCWGTDFNHLYRAVGVMAKHSSRFPWADMITREYSLDEAEEALRDVQSLSVTKALIVPGRQDGEKAR